MGNNAGKRITTASFNSLFGQEAGFKLTTGGYNTATGVYALTSAVGATYNTANGFQSLTAATGNGNTGVGYNSGSKITTGTNNTFLGYSTGTDALQLVSATNSMALGYNTWTTASNQIVLGNSITQTILGRSNNNKLLFGADLNASIYYNGTNLIINPKEVGTGNVQVLGDINATSNIRTDGNIYVGTKVIIYTGADGNVWISDGS